MHLVTAAQMQSLDRRTIEEAKVPGTRLMERAGTGIVKALEPILGSPTKKKVLIFCGKGNNGGDGFVVARLLRRKRAHVQVLLFARPQELTGDARAMYRRFVKLAGTSAIKSHPSEKFIRMKTSQADIIVDALLGTGLSSAVKDLYRLGIEVINDSSAPTVAVDIPSGIHCDTGAVLGMAVKAELTVTFGCPKIGLYVGEAIDYAGIIVMTDIGIPKPYVEALHVQTRLLTKDTVMPLLPSRHKTAHKGTFGHAGIVAGSPGKTGAAVLAARAALRTGAGLVTVATPRSVNSIVEAKLVEAMTLPMSETPDQTFARSALSSLVDFANRLTTVAIGPGLSIHAETGEVIRELLPHLERPCVLDADALNLLVGHVSVLSSLKIPPILTPHPGEMARLLGETSPQNINRDRLGIAREFAQTHQVFLVLKGARTIIASPDGQTAICPTGNPGMATAGMGDALTGMIVGLLAQGLNQWDAARAGVYLHGSAGDLAAHKLGQGGLIASDLIECIPYSLNQRLTS